MMRTYQTDLIVRTVSKLVRQESRVRKLVLVSSKTKRSLRNRILTIRKHRRNET